MDQHIRRGATVAPLTPIGWKANFVADFARYRKHHPNLTAPAIFFLEQGLWALVIFRMSSAVYQSDLSGFWKRPLLVLSVAAQKWIEIVAGISLPYKCRIGPGLYIGHFGNIIVSSDAIIGDHCNISQGVTIGVSGRGDHRGVPRIGSRVYIATNAVVCGPIAVGDDAVIAANSLVIRDVLSHTTVMGVPARRLNECGSAAYL